MHDFGALSGEFFDSVIGWDSRLVRTLRLLFSSPGALTEEFVAGRRARYIGPLRLYLIASVLFFATYSLVLDPVLVTIAGLGDPQVPPSPVPARTPMLDPSQSSVGRSF